MRSFLLDPAPGAIDAWTAIEELGIPRQLFNLWQYGGEDPSVSGQECRVPTPDQKEEAIETVLTREDCAAWHKAETTPRIERLVETFGVFQIWGMPNPQQGEEPLRVILE